MTEWLNRYIDDPIDKGHYCADCGIALWKRQTFRRLAFDGSVYICHKCFLENPFDETETQETEAWEG
jgi:hypothetical protein